MNYKKIAKFIKDARHLTIWNDGSLQYISDGVAVYPVFGMPKMNEMEMLNFLGLMDKSSAISTVMKPAPEFLKNASYDECSDSILEKTGPLIINRGEVYRSFYTESGAVVVKNCYISAVEMGVDKDIPVIHCLTEIRNINAVAVFVGFDLYAIVMPIDTKGLYKEYLGLSTMLQLAEQAQIRKTTEGFDEGEE